MALIGIGTNIAVGAEGLMKQASHPIGMVSVVGPISKPITERTKNTLL